MRHGVYTLGLFVMNAYRLVLLVAIVSLIGGCAPLRYALEWMGMVAPDGSVTPPGETVSGTIYAFTGIALARVWDSFQKRGIQNVKNVVSKKTGLVSSLWSMAAILLGWHSPGDVKKAEELAS